VSQFSHLNEHGQAVMVDVSGKQEQLRIARASGRISLSGPTIFFINEHGIKKGNVIAVSEIAGIQAAKRTSELIPLCHPLQLDKVEVRAIVEEDGIKVESKVISVGRTGVEMEALTAVSAALLTIYDMCKAVDKTMKIGEITLLEKVKHDVKNN
jgi:cyclic pyranopterin monophosphate synthase